MMKQKEYTLDTGNRNQNRQFLIIVSLVLLLSGIPGTASSGKDPAVKKQTIVLSTIFPPNLPAFSEMSDIYTEAFGRLGYGFVLIHQPGERAMIDANQGVADGEAARITDIDRERYANLIRVPESIITIKDGAYAVDEAISIDGYGSLASTSYRVGSMKGVKSIEQKLPLYIDKEHIVSFTNIKQGFEMLKARRIDVFIIGTQVDESSFMKSHEYDAVKRVGIVETKILYPWLYKRNKDLVQPLADMLRTMKSEGKF